MRLFAYYYSGTQYLISGLGIEKGKRPDNVWSCFGPHARTKFISLDKWFGYRTR